MLSLDKILDTAKALYQLSPEKAKELGYKETGGGDDTGGSSEETVSGADSRIRVSRGQEWGGPKSTPVPWGPRVAVNGITVDRDSLSARTAKELDRRLESVLKTLVDALESEKVEVPRRQAASAAEAAKQAKVKARLHDKNVRKALAGL